jgi:hypothetical protein
MMTSKQPLTIDPLHQPWLTVVASQEPTWAFTTVTPPGVPSSASPSIETFFETVPEETVEQMAARHRARLSSRQADTTEYLDVDLPLVDDGDDW